MLVERSEIGPQNRERRFGPSAVNASLPPDLHLSAVAAGLATLDAVIVVVAAFLSHVFRFGDLGMPVRWLVAVGIAAILMPSITRLFGKLCYHFMHCVM